MKKVLVFGTFDYLHDGHINFFKQAKKFGDYLVVLVAKDETVLDIKKNQTVFDEQTRLKKVEECGLADEVVLGSKGDKYEILKIIKPTVICLGYDQSAFVDKLEEKLKEFALSAEIVRLKSYKPEIYKSSKMRGKII